MMAVYAAITWNALPPYGDFNQYGSEGPGVNEQSLNPFDDPHGSPAGSRPDSGYDFGVRFGVDINTDEEPPDESCQR